MVDVVWTEPAKMRLRGISDYLKKEAGKRIAKKIRDQIYARANILVENPKAGQREELLKDRPEEFRYLVEGNYKIVYWLEPGKATISTVFDCRQNPEKIKEVAGKK